MTRWLAIPHAPPRASSWSRRWAPPAVVLLGMVLLTFLDALSVERLPAVHQVRVAADLLVGALAVAATARFQPLACAVTGGLAILLLSLVLRGLGPEPPFLGAAELAGAGVLLAVAIREAVSRPSAVAGVATTTAAVLVGGTARQTPGLGVGTDLTYLGALVIVAAGAGLWLRSGDRDRARVDAMIRQGERLALARELHDIAAHHVAGIVVQAQALQHVAGTRPQLALEALPQIEHAGVTALEAMRELVTTLRSAAAEQSAEPTYVSAANLRCRMDRTLAQAPLAPSQRLSVDVNVHAPLPAPLAATLDRVVAESLLNVARHAATARTVCICLIEADDTITLEIRDDADAALAGSTEASGSPGEGLGSGLGLLGLSERLRPFAGTLHAGPVKPHGWQVTARVPVLGEAQDARR